MSFVQIEFLSLELTISFREVAVKSLTLDMMLQSSPLFFLIHVFIFVFHGDFT